MSGHVHQGVIGRDASQVERLTRCRVDTTTALHHSSLNCVLLALDAQ